jgi:hypothetical protein
VPDRKAALPKTDIKVKCTVLDNIATVTCSSAVYARYVYLEADDVTAPWSDNFFDIPAGEEIAVTVELPDDRSADEFLKTLKIKTLADIEPLGSRFKDRWQRVKMFMRNKNYLYWFVFKLMAILKLFR